MSSPATIQIATAIGVLGSAVSTGTLITLSNVTTRTLSQSPPPLFARQWKRMLLDAARTVPPTAVISAAAFLYAAYHTPEQRARWALAAAAGLVFGILPFTVLFMLGLNEKLFSKATDLSSLGIGEGYVEKSPVGEDVFSLASRWAKLNTVRIVLTLMAAATGMWASTLTYG